MTEQPPYRPPYQPPGPPATPPPGQYGYAPPPPTSSKAVTALVLGIVGLASCPFASIPAIFVGRSATREIDASQGRLGGRGIATAGFVLGIVGTTIVVLAFLLVVVVFVFGGLVKSSFEESCNTVDTNDTFSVECS
jgi:hypothetical protein